MPRPSSQWPYWRTPDFNPGVGASEDAHLPDDVIIMFQESFNPDGLDFLRRGPRTAAERLAYTQRVAPDAHLNAQPAPMDAQRRFADHGVVDQGRHFVGPDRVLYLRSPDSAEPEFFGARRGFETAVGGLGPALPADTRAGAMMALVNSNSDAPTGMDSLRYRSDGIPVAPDARLTEEAERELDEILQRYRDYADYGRRHGHDQAAAAMERFLSGSGQPMRLDSSWLRSVPSVREAETYVHQYFQEWMTGEMQPETESEQITEDLLALSDGATLQGSSTWTRRFTPSLLSEQNALAAVGQTNLKGTGSITFRREGDRIRFDGAVTMRLDDTYDWQAGEWGIVPRPDESFPWIEQNRHDDAIKLQNHRNARPFRIYSQWLQSVRGTMRVRGNRLILETAQWQDRQR
jgi:hypothetical protein